MKTILVVDDEWLIASVLEAVLLEAGYRVVTAANGRAALDRVTETKPDIILLDYMMPVMNGLALLKQLAAHPEYAEIAVILMTSLPEPSMTSEKQIRSYLQKPFLDSELLEAIEAVLSEPAS